MSPEETDQAIEALPDSEHERLCDAAVQHWRFRAQNWALPVAIFAIMFALAFAMRVVVKSYWPGSLAVATFAILVWHGIFFGMIRFVLSMRFTEWRIRWATRREYKSRCGAA